MSTTLASPRALLVLTLLLATPALALDGTERLQGEYSLEFPKHRDYLARPDWTPAPLIVLDFDGEGGIEGTLYYRGHLVELDASRSRTWQAREPGQPSGPIEAHSVVSDGRRRIALSGTYSVDENGFVEATLQPVEPLFLEAIEDDGCPPVHMSHDGGDLQDRPDRLELLLTEDGRTIYGEYHAIYEYRPWWTNALNQSQPREWRSEHGVSEVRATRRWSDEGLERLRRHGGELRDLP